MKNINDIAKFCCSDWETIFRATKRLNIIPALQKGRRKYFDEYQQELILDHLFYLGKIEFIIYESKINWYTLDYSRTEFIEKGLIC